MSRNRVWIAVVAVFVLCFANLLYAQSTPSTNPDAMVDVLKTLESKGVLTHQEFESLKHKVTENAADPMLKSVAMQEPGAAPANVVSAMDSGVGFHASRFDVAFSGEVNGFYVHTRAETNPAHALVNADGLALVAQGAMPSSSIRSGLLPSDLSIKISTQEHGWDVAVFFGIWPAIQNSNFSSVETGIGTTGALGIHGSSLAGGTPGIDFRQNFATLGRPKFGTLKIGRDLGLFGQEAILNDMTLLGVGSTQGGNQFPANVTFGRIGVGYTYTDFLPQITYTTPSEKGLQAAFGIMQPLDDPLDEVVRGGTLNGHGQPMIQAKLTYTAPLHGPVKAKFWSNFVTQSEEAALGGDAGVVFGTPLAQGKNVRMYGVDYGAKLDFKGLEIVGYGYNGWGLGTTALLFEGLGLNAAGNVDPRPSQGYYGQATYTTHKNTFGFSYGQSNLSPTGSSDYNVGSAAFIRLNSSYIAQYRYAVTKWDNLVAEYGHNISENQARVKATDDTVSFGTIVFF